MAGGVWGIDIGQCALKALRCKLGDDGETLVATAFDYIEYPKILSQPEADREELISDALAQFLSRNDLRGDKVGISVSGQSGLARFFKPPPVEQKKIPDIVMYEARQQIPFSLDEVIWDYQQMPGASEEDGIALDMEIGLFAMKRDQVFKSIRPFEDHDVELDMVQLSPLCLYNCASHDLLEALPDDEEYDSEDPPESIALLSLGTDASDLVVTNGYRVWQRSIPLGGSHFTRQLTKELKLTFAKAEHLKRNARQAEDPRKIFQAMRPVFNDLVTEVQRSLNYFQSIDRNAKIGKVYLLGNATKLPGLSQYLGTNIGYEVVKIDKFSKLTGKGVVGAPSFSENVLAFPVCYGLCLQGLGKGNLLTSLLPQEILTDRLIKSKKPWAVAIAGTLLLGLCLNYTLHANAWRSAHDDNFKDAVSAVSGVKSQSQQFKTRDQQLLAQAQQLMEVGDQVIGGAERRLLWLELFRAINDAMPRDEELANPSMISKKPIAERPELYFDYIESIYYQDLKQWYDGVADKIKEAAEAEKEQAEAAATSEEVAAPAEGAGETAEEGAAAPQPPADEKPVAPEGPGWVIEIRGHHYFNTDPANQGAQYLRNTFLKNLKSGEVTLPPAAGEAPMVFTTKELGISHPVIIEQSQLVAEKIPNPDYVERSKGSEERPARGAGETPAEDPENPQFFEVRRYDFAIQFCWQETPASKRLQMKRELQRKLEKATEGEPAP